MLSFFKNRTRRVRTDDIAHQLINIIGNDPVVLNIKEFIDEAQIREVIEATGRLSGISIRANVFQGRVFFHMD